MAQSTKIQAACLLLLLIASLASSSFLQQLVPKPLGKEQAGRVESESYAGDCNTQVSFLLSQARQPDALQPGHRAEGRADETLLIPTRTKRDTYFPVCVFCCRCCNNPSCGICCKT
ncbi:hepcidin isoform X1 [Microtus pennsylvanicus]|uniref:hepcidin isoform X1 n=1 Tax=Microtus pennsylvanicus TaxID=10058 RepID=UPI003F6AD40A